MYRWSHLLRKQLNLALIHLCWQLMRSRLCTLTSNLWGHPERQSSQPTISGRGVFLPWTVKCWKNNIKASTLLTEADQVCLFGVWQCWGVQGGEGQACHHPVQGQGADCWFCWGGEQNFSVDPYHLIKSNQPTIRRVRTSHRREKLRIRRQADSIPPGMSLLGKNQFKHMYYMAKVDDIHFQITQTVHMWAGTWC